jgi:hypothetical protein
VSESLKRLTAFVVESVEEDTVITPPELAMRKQLVNVALSLKHSVCEDPWYTCPQATQERDGGETIRDDMTGQPCECHVVETQQKLFTVLAAMYADRPDGRNILITAGRF